MPAATITHKHDGVSVSGHSLDYPVSYNISHERAINTRANQGGGGAYKSMYGLNAGLMYYPRNSSGYMMAVLDIFALRRSNDWVYGPASTQWNSFMGNYVAWSMYKLNGPGAGNFQGPWCGPGTTTSRRLDFGIYPLGVFFEFLSSFMDYDVTNGAKLTPYTWQTVTGVSAPTAVYSTTASVYGTTSGGVTTLTPSGSAITLKTGTSASAYTMGGKSLRFHGFISYTDAGSGSFSYTKYAFTTLNNQDTVRHTYPNANYGTTPAYPTRGTTEVTHRAISLCTILNSGTVKIPNIATWNPGGVLTASLAGAFPSSSAIPINTLGSTASQEGTTSVTDIYNDGLFVPDWMTEEIFVYESGSMYGEGELPTLADSAYYGTSSAPLVLAYWDNVTREWSEYQAYSTGTTYYTWYISIILDPMNNVPACNNVPFTTYVETPVYTSESTLGIDVHIYSDTGLTTPYNLMPYGEGWYTFRDSNNEDIRPSVVYRVRGDSRITETFEC